MTSDEELLERYAAQGDAGAFEEIVRRHVGMVYGAARRMVGESEGEDVAQAVFALLSRKAGAVWRQGHVAGWLHRTAMYCAVNVRKMQARRARYERESGIMRATEKPTGAPELVHDLDDALVRLAEREREAVLLRYLEGRSVAETAAALGVSQEAAGKRAGRGLEKLRAYFASRGYAVGSAAVVAGVLDAQAAQTVPEAVMAGALASGKGVVGTGAGTILKGVLEMMWWAKVKVAALVCVGAIVTTGAGGVWISQVGTAHAQTATLGAATVPAPPATTAAAAPLAGPAKTPKGTVIACFAAALAGDFDTHIKCFDQPTAQQIRVIRQYVHTAGAARELMQATAEKFGEASRAALLEPMGMGGDPADVLAAAKETIHGDTAEVDLREWGPGIVPLVKVGDVWLIKAEVLVTLNAGSVAETDRHVPDIQALTTAIKAGKFKTLDEAKQAMMKAMGATQMRPENGEAGRAKAIAELRNVYKLADGENLKQIRPPFPKQRAVFADTFYPEARGSANMPSLGFTWANGELAPSYMSYESPALPSVVGLVLRMEWYNVDHLERIRWKPGPGDWVMRDGLPIGDRLAALGKIISEDTGKAVKFERKMVRRPCIVLKGEVRPAPENARHFHVVVVTVEPVKEADLPQWIEGRGSKDKADKQPQFQFKETAKLLDAPFFSEPPKGQPYRQDIGSMFYTGVDAHLDRNQPGYEAKLGRVLENIKAQVGGEWSIEQREIETWEPKVE